MMAAENTSVVPCLPELLAGFVTEQEIANLSVHGLANDSRQVKPGDVFFAVSGYAMHGLEYVDEAIRQGAIAIVWEPASSIEALQKTDATIPWVAVENLRLHLSEIAGRFYGHPSSSMQCIAVTGTDGKTSVSHFIAQALQAPSQPCGLIGTLGYGVFGDLQPASHTTPDALKMQSELSRLNDQGTTSVVMEVSSHALDQGRVGAVHFDTAILTNLSRDHLDYHGTMAAYAEVKASLFHFSGLNNAVINADDTLGVRLLEEIENTVRVIAYSIDPNFDTSQLKANTEWLHASAIKNTSLGQEVVLNSSWGDATVNSQLIGNFNIANLLATAAALLASGQSYTEVIAQLPTISSVPGRMELIGGDQQPVVVIDYAHTANALETVLTSLKSRCRSELICVFGAGGNRDKGKRSAMGKVAESLADWVVVTSDNPRHEDPEKILDEIVEGIVDRSKVVKIEDRAEAIEAAIETADVQDVILVAGKGHEETQKIGDQCVSFSDREQVIQALKRWQE
ncbi:MAG: UDP-N-acetylmuramoyl-L-alanyl-D-glutamate--2,6-diaminopimelate ligase [Gammaproteobacteria bacterium]